MPVVVVAPDQKWCEGWQGVWDNRGGGFWAGNDNNNNWRDLGTASHFPLGVTILRGSTVNSASFTVTPSGSSTATVKIKAELAASPPTIPGWNFYAGRRGCTPGAEGTTDAGIVCAAFLDLINEAWVNGVDKVYDVTALIAELVAAFDVDKVEMFVDDHDHRSAWGWVLYLAQTSLSIDYSPPVTPAVTTQAASAVAQTTVTLNGTVTAINDTDIVEEGFVVDIVSHVLPGDVAPAATGYTMWPTIVGVFGLGAFFFDAVHLNTGTFYYARAYAKNDTGHYAYGAEITFNTFAKQVFAINGWTDGFLDVPGNMLGFQGGTLSIVNGVFYSGLFAVPGRLKNFKMKYNVASPGADTVTLNKIRDIAGTATAFPTAVVLTWALGDTYQEDLVHAVDVYPGEALGWLFSGAARPHGVAEWTADFEPLTDGYLPQSQCFFGGSPTDYDGYAGLFGGFLSNHAGAQDVNHVKTVMTHAGSMKHFAVRWMNFQPSGWPDYSDLTLMKNGVATAVTFHAVAGAGGDHYLYDDTNVVSFVPGDLLWWQAVSNPAPGSEHFGFMPNWTSATFAFINMDYEVYGFTAGVPSRNNGAVVSFLSTNNVGSWVNFNPGAPAFFNSMKTFKDIYTAVATLECRTAPGVGKSWEAELWANGAKTGFKIVVSGAGLITTVAKTVTLPSDASQIDWVLTPTNAPALDYVSLCLLLGKAPVTGLPKSQISRVPRVQSIVT
jgi:hypothetical protein